ncbi:hypothetical protein JAAARDRAFT_35757 [Jaapia argillacea MUCL 33604]|uniref:Uncharacterized protein n=1 Tax=Jaapia argillacea MUCL 33604 TaxID=933084 RepID=A0A067Q0Z1_9AGAM|nr:hypothetical protein JAAARDRAFT_35757 [Jaapia argillacea MUCL 33604]
MTSHSPPNRLWHPNLTGYRLTVLATTTGYGLTKAGLAYHGYPGRSSASITVEWIFSVVIFLVLSWLSLYEDSYPEAFPWLFQTVFTPSLSRFVIIRRDGMASRDRVGSADDRRSRASIGNTGRPSITGFRLLVSLSAILFGSTKAIFSYAGYSTVPNTLDWVTVLLSSIGFYWMGLYENAPVDVMPVLFRHDYASSIQEAPRSGYCAFIVVLHLLFLAFLFCLGLGIACFLPWILLDPDDFSSQSIFDNLAVKAFWVLVAGVAVVYAVFGIALSVTATAKIWSVIIPPARAVVSALGWKRGPSGLLHCPKFLKQMLRPSISLISKIAYVLFHIFDIILCVCWGYLLPWITIYFLRQTWIPWEYSQTWGQLALNLYAIPTIFISWTSMGLVLTWLGVHEGITTVRSLVSLASNGGRSDECHWVVVKMQEIWGLWLVYLRRSWL